MCDKHEVVYIELASGSVIACNVGCDDAMMGWETDYLLYIDTV